MDRLKPRIRLWHRCGGRYRWMCLTTDPKGYDYAGYGSTPRAAYKAWRRENEALR